MMTPLIRHFLFLLSINVLLTACDGREKIDYEPEEESGTLKMLLDVKVSVENASTETFSLVPRAETPSTDYFIVKVYKTSTNELAKDINGKEINYRYNELPEIITLNTGNYYLIASSHEPENAVWEVPYYEGRTNFTIEKAKLTTIQDVVCKIHNVRIQLAYSKKILNELKPDFTVTVDNGLDNGFLVYGIADTTKLGYFMPTPSFKITLKGTRRDGDLVSHTEMINDIAAGQERKITMDVILTGSLNANLQIDINTSVIDKIIKVPTDEDAIVDPDPNPDPSNPSPSVQGLSVAGRGFDIRQSYPSFPVGAQREIIVDITAEKGIKELWVDIDSPFLTQEELENAGLPKKFNLADPDLYEMFGPTPGLGLIQTTVANAKKLTFDISNFTALILAPGTHNFILSVTDNNGQSVQETLALVTE